MPVKIITTEDGSHSLFNEELNETYHSIYGAKREAMHVFIREGLEAWTAENDNKDIRILEVGLGTGLNALLTAIRSQADNRNIHFTSLEPFPVKKEVYENLNYFNSGEEKELLIQIHETDWETEVSLSSSFKLFKAADRLEDFKSSDSFDIIYFDAFAPRKQPEVWSLENLRKCFYFLNLNGILTTYCAQGRFKRNLRAAGFEVETLRGAAGKKEMVRGRKAVSIFE
ncbi:MAG: tRNA (5-methylaminomethyl-2-thiouridine)(34)-methyltransferase MnmD [Ekhidna sp.]|nr:tRNA (5-methylaminomethyl-2-thiouridine)(34)-methyltransferase MnmD [Ekhidna sp.]MBC6409751.1 tRNA (5-methylaminomethyl-2-thiouridine)(34)-methyltransferase MnmD [Ekhidna sp.]MBC6425261.1 tRNA (5-methylaminomethyl-2-thiouridine)(34)-methyltransferase MnmD [Ekhidna sp.]